MCSYIYATSATFTVCVCVCVRACVQLREGQCLFVSLDFSFVCGPFCRIDYKPGTISLECNPKVRLPLYQLIYTVNPDKLTPFIQYLRGQ